MNTTQAPRGKANKSQPSRAEQLAQWKRTRKGRKRGGKRFPAGPSAANKENTFSANVGAQSNGGSRKRKASRQGRRAASVADVNPSSKTRDGLSERQQLEPRTVSSTDETPIIKRRRSASHSPPSSADIRQKMAKDKANPNLPSWVLENASVNDSAVSGESFEDVAAMSSPPMRRQLQPSAAASSKPRPRRAAAVVLAKSMPAAAADKTVVFETPKSRKKKTRTRSEPLMAMIPSTPMVHVQAQCHPLPLMKSPSAWYKNTPKRESAAQIRAAAGSDATAANVRALINKLTATKMQRELLSAQARMLQVEVKKSRKQILELKAQLAAASTNVSSNDTAASPPPATTEDSSSSADIESMRAELERAQKAKAELEEFKARVEAEAKGRDAELQSTAERLRREVEEQTKQRRDAEKALASATAATARAKDRIQAMEKDAEGHDQKVRLAQEEAQRACAKIKVLEDKLNTLRERRREEEMVRRRLHNRIQDLLGRVRVFCRLRPPSEDDAGNSEFLPSVQDGAGVLSVKQPTSSVSGAARSKTSKFVYDGVFASHSSQVDVFSQIEPLIVSSMDGYDVTIFAYGQTGSGKTYTMFGPSDADLSSSEQRGVIPRAVDSIFDIVSKAKTQQWTYRLSVSIVEIYMESIRDLLAPTCKKAIKHEVKTRRDGSVYVSNLNRIKADTPEELHGLIRQAAERATRAATDMNSRSSRAHTLFRLHIQGKNLLSKQTVQSTLTLVDLAGSERVGRSGAEGTRLDEAKSINVSLSSLGTCVKALAENSGHVPYRNSKLTYLLHKALAGSGKTAFLVNISPDDESVGETMCTLRFAQGLKDVKCK